jgi:hypothetical protein
MCRERHIMRAGRGDDETIGGVAVEALWQLAQGTNDIYIERERNNDLWRGDPSYPKIKMLGWLDTPLCDQHLGFP